MTSTLDFITFFTPGLANDVDGVVVASLTYVEDGLLGRFLAEVDNVVAAGLANVTLMIL